MKKTGYLLGVALGLLFFPGCNGSSKTDQDSNIRDYSQIAGVWKAEGKPFVITLTSDGKVRSAVITPGQTEVTPNGITEIVMQDDSKGYYKVGNCPVRFNSRTRELTVEIHIEHLMIPFPNDKLEGNVRHVFTGFVSEDGLTWDSTWFEFFDYGSRFPMDPEAVGEPIRFIRVPPSTGQ